MQEQKDNRTLSVCIPTFNRSEILDSNLKYYLPLLKQNEVSLLVSDNCSTDNTIDILKEHSQNNELLKYYKQDKNIEDRNFPYVLRKNTADFAWLLSDKHRINKDGISRIKELINQDDYDLIVTNHTMRVKNIPTKVYTDCEQMLKDIGWHMTDICTLIFSKSLIATTPFERFSNTNFMHVGGIFEALATKDSFKVLWLNENLFERLAFKNIPGGWNSKVYRVWVESWSNAILSLPPSHYSIQSKIECLQKHNRNTKIFKLRRMFKYKRLNFYRQNTYKRLKSILPLATGKPKWLHLLILLYPTLRK